MSDRPLVIVESPTKARTIARFLNKDFVIMASNGHVRDLPNRASEVPEKLKGEGWAKLGVNVEDDFAPLYVIPGQKQDSIKKLKGALKEASVLYLATDEDREGESISWHLKELLKPKVSVKRLVFHEITKEAITRAFDSARDIDLNLVQAQETRRIVDRLYGYTISPILWKKMAPNLSAGRVQSVAVKLLVERERERIKFRRATYWGLDAELKKGPSGTVFEADLVQLEGKRVATGRDFDANTGLLRDPKASVLLGEEQVKELRERLLSSELEVSSVEKKPYSTNPPPPFVTSSLQQEANRKLRMTARHTMSVAQQLYENGFITYMRTDSTALSEQALSAARSFIERDYGKDYLPQKPRVYKSSVRNAQEAHEAIRPAGEDFAPPKAVGDKLGVEAFKLS